MKMHCLRFIHFLILFSVAMACHAQRVQSLYFIPGQGSDKRIFDSLSFESGYTLKYLEYGTPERKISLAEYARQISHSIDTSEKFVLIGVSMGGMICAELNEILNPEKVIIISSAKNRKELPFRYRFQRIIPVFEIVPARGMFWGAKILQPLVEPDRNTNRSTFISMLYHKNPTYIKRTTRMIIRWNRTSNTKPIIHVHGTNDHTIPMRNVAEPSYVVEDGSHMMTLTRAKEINAILNQELASMDD